MDYHKIILFPVKDNNLFVNEFGCSSGNAAATVRPNVRNTFIIHFVTKGTAQIGGYKIQRGEAFMLAQNVIHTFSMEGDFEHFWIGFGGEGAIKLLNAFSIPIHKHILFKTEDSQGIEDYLRQQLKLLSETENGKQALYVLMYCLPHLKRYKNYAPTTYALQAKTFIDNNYKYDLPMEKIAKNLNITEKHLCKLFKKAYGISPQQYLIKTRMTVAQDLLLNTDMLIKEVADNVGFSSQFAFSTAFKHHFDITPTQQRVKGAIVMQSVSLPPIKQDKELALSHFPNNLYAAVFRLWETVDSHKIAYALDISHERVLEIADQMGLPSQKHNVKWETQGYITTIKNSWHILTYEQLLKALGWTKDKLALILKEDDFLSVKLGHFKPYCKEIRDVPLNDKQKEQLKKIKATMQESFSGLFTGKQPFDFFEPTTDTLPFMNTADGLRIIYSFCGLYSGVLDNDISISYPEEMLKSYCQMGINAIWLPAILYQVTEFPFDKSYSVGYEKRQERLRALIALADKYGIKVYLYLNEPRSMPISFFDKHPGLLGKYNDMYGALCTSEPGVLEYVENAVESLCRALPGLGGFITITMSENLTHCKSRREGTECEKCKNVPVGKLISDVIHAITKGSGKVDKNIRTIVWSWAWNGYMSQEEIKECIRSLPRDVIIQSNSEALKPFVIGGVEGFVQDYSISIPGPGDVAKSVWSAAKEAGLEIAAKVQINNTWECSTVPFLPVFDLIREHMTGLGNEGIRHLTLSWTLGGYPSINLKVASECLIDPSEEKYEKLLLEEYGEYAPTVKKAAKLFSDAFREFPFHKTNIYNGPQNSGPANLLFEKPTGLSSTMTGFAMDDLDMWRAIYPRDIYRSQLKALGEKWETGLEAIKDMPECEFTQMAYAGYALFKSSYYQTDFIMSRDEKNTERMAEIALEEKKLAILMYELMNKNPRIGFEAANHYYFNKGMLAEKAICCDYIEEKFNQKKV